MTYEEMKIRIEELDLLIESERDDNNKIVLIEESLRINALYIHGLRKGIPVRIVFCVLLSVLYLIGLFIFLPQIIVRNCKINICKKRMKKLEIERRRILVSDNYTNKIYINPIDLEKKKELNELYKSLDHSKIQRSLCVGFGVPLLVIGFFACAALYFFELTTIAFLVMFIPIIGLLLIILSGALYGKKVNTTLKEIRKIERLLK